MPTVIDMSDKLFRYTLMYLRRCVPHESNSYRIIISFNSFMLRYNSTCLDYIYRRILVSILLTFTVHDRILVLLSCGLHMYDMT